MMPLGSFGLPQCTPKCEYYEQEKVGILNNVEEQERRALDATKSMLLKRQQELNDEIEMYNARETLFWGKIYKKHGRERMEIDKKDKVSIMKFKCGKPADEEGPGCGY
jgi:hypothetical protein